MIHFPIIRYYRDKKGRPIGCVVAVAPEKVGWSLCKKGDALRKEVGRAIALGRAMHGHNNHAIPQTLINLYLEVYARSKGEVPKKQQYGVSPVAQLVSDYYSNYYRSTRNSV